MQSVLLAMLLYLGLSSVAFAQDAATELCPNNPNVPVSIHAVFGNPTFDDTASIAQLTNLSRDAYHVIPEGLTLGLTHYQPVLNVNPASSARDLPGGMTCVRVEHVDIVFGYKDVVVYVANEIPKGTCGFNRVMAHEQKHVRVQEQILNQFIPVMQQKIQAYLAQNGAMQSQNYGEAVTWLREQVETLAQNSINEIYDENTRLQHNIDTVQEYTEISNSCDGQLRGIVRNFLHDGQ